MKKNVIIIVVSAILVLGIGGYLVFAKMIDNKKLTTYDVTFETSGGTLIEFQTIKEGDVVIKPTDPTKEGYIFVQWLYQGTTYDFSSPVNSNLLLTADWVEKKEDIETYIVIFNSEGGTTIPNQIIEKGNSIQKPEDPTKEGYKFKGWVLNEVEYNFETIVENNIELKALWEKIEVKNDKPSKNSSTNKPTNSGTNNNDSSNNNDGTKKPETPTLRNVTLTACGSGCSEYVPELVNGKYYYDLGINKLDYNNSVSGYVIYEKNGDNYKEVSSNLITGADTIEVSLMPGEKKTYVAKVYALNSKGEKIYSDYSNVVTIDHSI